MNNYGYKKLAPALVMGLMSFASQAAAQDLQSNVSFLVVEGDANGAEVLVDRNSVRPGETIEYAIKHINGTDEDLFGIVVMAPIPNGVTFAPATEKSSVKATFEIQAEMDPELDGLEWSTLPATRKVAGTDGGFVIEPLPATAIEAVRWTLASALETGATSLNTYRVTVD